MKKKAKRLISALLAVTVAFGVSVAATGCKSGSGSDTSPSTRRDNKKYDATKTQINVQFYQAGYGEDWIYDYEAKFEEAYKDVSFEDGKTGVQVWHNGDMSNWTTTKMSSSKYDIFFFENERYYNFLDGTLEDLTDIVKENIPGEEKSIEKKLNDQQKDFFAVKSSASSEGRYYALPHYYGTYGIVYNVELFDRMNYYFNTDGEVMAGKDVTNKVKSNGPDGKTGVIDDIDYSLDDGLPATYEQFYDLCKFINSTNNTPLCWPGKYYEHHLLNLYDNLVASYEGKEQMLLNYGFNEGVDASVAPKATDLITVDNNGNVTFDDEPTAITTANGYELARQAGKYYAYGFLSEIMKPQNKWYAMPGSFSGSYSHTDNQRDFLMFGTNLSNTKKTTAMLIDGPWWQNEAKTVFADMVKKGGEQYAATSRKFGWMPLPHATEDKVGDKTVYSDYLKTFVCMKSGLSDGVKKAAKKFLQFICSDEMLVSFTKATGTLRAYDYEVSGSMSKLSDFSKSVINYVKRSDVVYKFSSGNYYNRNSDKLNYDTVYQTVIGNKTVKNPGYAIHEYSTSATAWFKSYYSTMKSNWAK